MEAKLLAIYQQLIVYMFGGNFHIYCSRQKTSQLFPRWYELRKLKRPTHLIWSGLAKGTPAAKGREIYSFDLCHGQRLQTAEKQMWQDQQGSKFTDQLDQWHSQDGDRALREISKQKLQTGVIRLIRMESQIRRWKITSTRARSWIWTWRKVMTRHLPLAISIEESKKNAETETRYEETKEKHSVENVEMHNPHAIRTVKWINGPLKKMNG